MKIRALSDLHLEGYHFKYEPLGEDVVVLSGDIHTKCRHKDLLDQIPSNIRVILISGNHEHYGSTFEGVNSTLKDLENEYTNLTYLDNDSVDIDNVSFFGGTMWTDFNLYGYNDAPYVIQDTTRYIADYQWIDRFAQYPSVQGKQRWTINDTIEQYNTFNKNFDHWVKRSEGKKRVCVSHFLPSIKSVDKKFEGSILNGYFASNNENRVELVDLWLHGHTHSSCDYLIGSSRVVCNPKGYGTENKNSFNPNLIIEV